jgi:hypothetical protein
MQRTTPTAGELKSGAAFFWSRLPDAFAPLASEDWSVDPETAELLAPRDNWRWRQMTADKGGLRRTSAVRWLVNRA